MLKRAVKILNISLISLFLVACMHSSGLKKSQVRMLENKGFKLTDEGWSLALPARLLFSFDSAIIAPEHQVILTELAKNLRKYKLERLKIVGHTDNVGAEAYNQTLSEQRAASVGDVLIRAGYDANNLEIVGRGMSQPIVDNDTEENRAENRRVVIIIIP